MAIEDAAVLGNLLSHLTHPAQLPLLLQAYEDLRLPRTAETQTQSRLNQRIFHLHDGPEQERRDAEMRRAAELEREMRKANGEREEKGEGNVNQWADERKSRVQFGYDADEAVEAWWCAVGEGKLSELARGGVDGGEVAPWV